MLQIVAEAPQPTLVIDGHHAVISGVRYLHMAHCPWCRNALHVATDGGTIRMGIDNNVKKPRWYEKDNPGGNPEAPAECPTCGTALPRRHYHWYPPSPVYLARPLMNEAWTTIRATHPHLSGPADRAAGIIA